jgi:multiple sugar transport system substrate-binding protein
VTDFPATAINEEEDAVEDTKLSLKLTRRQLLALGGQTAVVAFLAGCGATPTPAPEPTKAPSAATAVPTKPPAPAPSTIEFLAWGDTTDGPAWEKLGPAYTAKYPGQVINITPVADPNNNYYTKLQTMFAGGAPPDLASFQGWEWQVYADKNLLSPVDDLIARDKLTGPYPQGYLSVTQSVIRKGKTYLVPLQMAVMIMFYAKAIFDDAGMKYPTDDWTFDQFVDMAKKLTNADKKKFGYQANGNWYRDIGWIVLTGKREFDNVIDPKKSQFGDADVAKMLQTVAYDLPHVFKAAPNPTDTSGANTINTGACAMKYEGPWFLPQLNTPDLRAQKKEVVFDVVRMPKGAGAGRPHRGWGEGVCIVKTAKTEAAWRFASYLVSDEGNKMYSEITGRIPSNLQLAQTWWLPRTKELYGIQNGQAFLDAFKEGQIDVVSGVPRSKMWAEVVKPTAWDLINAGTGKPTDVLPKVDQKLQPLLDDYWKTQ